MLANSNASIILYEVKCVCMAQRKDQIRNKGNWEYDQNKYGTQKREHSCNGDK